ncbi:MAG TPA: PA domain-containing protein [Microlunatus sp.]|nr:PA domain-containing protein [Microlunatus sp.]
MNAALAIHGDYAYIGSRTDFHDDGEAFSGVMIVDISDPAAPEVVNVLGPPDTANPGESSRELRVWQSQDILIVLHTNCGGPGAHECHAPSVNNFKFFDISGDNATDPQLIAQVNQDTHEFFLWEDPNDPERALMFGGSAGSGGTALSIWDLSPLLEGRPPPRIHASPHGYTGIPPNLVTIDQPSAAAGTYQATGAEFGPAPDATGIAGDVVLVNDGTASPTQGCNPLVGFPAGAIALVDRGTCGFTQKANNAQNAGATGMIVANNAPGAPITMGGTDPAIAIPSVMVSQADGTTIKTGLPATGMVTSNPQPPVRSCHDTGVILGDAMLAGCAGGNGFSVWSLDPADGGSLEDPAILYSRAVPGVSIGHSASFSWDGEILIFGHEPGGGGQAQCQASTPEVNRTMFFFESRTGVELGRHVLPRPQTNTENCTIHNYNVVPTDKGHVLVHGSYQSGIGVVDFTDPANATEIASADPAPLSETGLVLGGDWSTYWYDGFIYESDIRRGLLNWKLSDPAVAGVRKLGHLNPQTQETTFAL